MSQSDMMLLFAGADLSRAVAGGTVSRPVVTAPLPPAVFQASGWRIGASMPVGTEAAGTVVAAGTSPAAQALLGKLVSVAPGLRALFRGGMHSQYRCVDATACLELPEGVRPADGAGALINPMTCLGMIEIMRSEGHSGLVLTAAAGNVGQILVRVCLEDGIPLVSIVRSPQQVDLLQKLGALYVCDLSSETFTDDLVRALTATSATLAFDALGGGTLASQILTAMQAASSSGAFAGGAGSLGKKQVYVYGALDRGPTVLSRNYGSKWGVGTYSLATLVEEAPFELELSMHRRIAGSLLTTFASEYSDEVSLAESLDLDNIEAYARGATGTKYLLRPNLE
jgi:NADPH:quinone reductase-like Zn-dependent oxidoreductase